MAMEYFGLLTGMRVDIEKPTLLPRLQSKSTRAFLVPTAKEITLANIDPVSRDAVTAHKLADFRRRKFSLILLPTVFCVMDVMLETLTPQESQEFTI